MAKREMDPLSKDMVQCKKDGFGCHYGDWRAAQDRPVVLEKKIKIAADRKICPQCGRPFKPSNKGRQVYCDIECQKKAQRARDKGKYSEYYRNYAARKRAEQRMAGDG